MTRKEFLNNYWRFYLMLEERFVNSLIYVELCNDNLTTYSMEFASELREIGSEVDVIMKELCGFAQTDIKTITDYENTLLSTYPDIINQEISGKEIAIKPFENWDASRAKKSLSWWDAYDSVKHGRAGNFELANLNNVFSALGALFILENYLLKKIVKGTDEPDIMDKNSSVFTMKNWETKCISMEGAMFVT